MLDVVIYPNLPNSDEVVTKHFNLVEVKEKSSIEEMKQEMKQEVLKVCSPKKY